MYESPPGGCRVGRKPPVHQALPVGIGRVLDFNFVTFGVWHTQAPAQSFEIHLLHCLCHCLWCQRSSCRQGKQGNELNTVHGRPDIAILYQQSSFWQLWRWVSAQNHIMVAPVYKGDHNGVVRNFNFICLFACCEIWLHCLCFPLPGV